MIGNAYAFSLEKHSLEVLPRTRARKPGAQVEPRGRWSVAWWDAPVGSPGWGGESLGAVGGAGGGGPSRLLPRSQAAISWPGSARNPLP